KPFFFCGCCCPVDVDCDCPPPMKLDNRDSKPLGLELPCSFITLTASCVYFEACCESLISQTCWTCLTMSLSGLVLSLAVKFDKAEVILPPPDIIPPRPCCIK